MNDPLQEDRIHGVNLIIAIEGIFHKIEKGGQVEKTNPICLGF